MKIGTKYCVFNKIWRHVRVQSLAFNVIEKNDEEWLTGGNEFLKLEISSSQSDIVNIGKDSDVRDQIDNYDQIEKKY